jgi:hypothetical protein
VRAHHDVDADGGGAAQNAIERIAGDHHRTAASLAQLGHGRDLLCQNPLGLAASDLDQVLRLVVVDDVKDGEFGAPRVRQETGFRRAR